MPKKKIVKKLEETTQIDGVVNTNPVLPTRMDVLFGNASMKYKVKQKPEYQAILAAMTVADLRNEAIRVGLIPTRNTDRLRKQLLLEFDKYMLSYNHTGTQKPTELSKDKQQIALEIFKSLK